jgi:hypothetical protein
MASETSRVSGFRIKFQGGEAAMKAMDLKRSAILAELTKEAEQVGFKIRGDAKAMLDSRPTAPSADSRITPRIRTHRLSRAITSIVQSTSGAVRVVVGVLAIVAYGRIQELGGTTRPHEIRPRRKLALRWASGKFIGPIRLTKGGKISRRQGGGLVFSRLVHHPGSRIPSRPYVRPAVEQNLGFIQSRWEAGVARGLKG